MAIKFNPSDRTNTRGWDAWLMWQGLLCLGITSIIVLLLPLTYLQAGAHQTLATGCKASPVCAEIKIKSSPGLTFFASYRIVVETRGTTLETDRNALKALAESVIADPDRVTVEIQVPTEAPRRKRA